MFEADHYLIQEKQRITGRYPLAVSMLQGRPWTSWKKRALPKGKDRPLQRPKSSRLINVKYVVSHYYRGTAPQGFPNKQSHKSDYKSFSFQWQMGRIVLVKKEP